MVDTVSMRVDTSTESIEQSIVDHLSLNLGRLPKTATLNDWYTALALSVRDRIMDRWMKTIETYIHTNQKSVSYLSAEFLIGPQLENNIINLGIEEQVKTAIKNLGLDYETLVAQEPEPGLGNGGLGRLAACFLDSLASLNIIGVGYGIHYEYGIFKQSIDNGWQVELTDNWLHLGNPWEIVHPEIAFNVNFGGHVKNNVWEPQQTVRGVACDVAVQGYKSKTVNLLRLWKAEASESFNFQAFNAGDYWRAVGDKVGSETITKVLYPNDEPLAGKKLRLQQQYFFVSCSIQDMIRVNIMRGQKITDFHLNYAIQLNDTHPSIAVAELMRLLIDVHGIDWDTAWDITQKTISYTNHTLLPEALEKWPVPLFQELLPRHMEIIFDINERFLKKVRASGLADMDQIRKLSIIDETGHRFVAMAHLAAIGSHAVNGVSELHSELLKNDVMSEFYRLQPKRFFNITNGVTPRRWIVVSNPKLASLITSVIGDEWIVNMEGQIHKIEVHVDDPTFRQSWQKIKQDNKAHLAKVIREKTGIEVDPSSLFDVQVKRFHEYKRQHLNVLYVISRYIKLAKYKKNLPPRTVIFGGKAAPGYFIAKLIIKLINCVSEVVNNDRSIDNRLKVVFFPDFNVKNGQLIYPACELSEQISTAGKEASGTGNMKFSMNGALTIGTLDGANIEIRDAVGKENFFLFGLTAPEIKDLRQKGYHPQTYVDLNPELKEVIELIQSGYFSPNDPHLFHPLINSLLHRDEYMLLADFASYASCQDTVDTAYSNPDDWTRKSIINVARMGKFSSDRSIREYADKIWGL